MKILRYIPLHLLVYLIIGILIGNSIMFKYISTIVLLIIYLSVYYIFSLKKTNKPTFSKQNYILAGFIFVLIGINSVSLNNKLKSSNHYTQFTDSINKASIRLIEKKKSNTFHHSFIANVEVLNDTEVAGKIKLNIPHAFGDTLRVGNQLNLQLEFSEIRAPLNPYEFNYKDYMLRQHIVHQVYLQQSDLIEINRALQNVKWTTRFRNNISNKLESNGFKGDELQIIQALLLGQRTEVSQKTIENYQKAGAIHILAISGLHVGIILMLLNFLLSPLSRIRNSRIIRLCLVILGIWSFALLAGFSAAVVRASAMFTAVAIGMMNNRRMNTYEALIISMFFLLLFKPSYLKDVGFQLSYLAVFFIIWLQPILSSVWKPKYKILNYPWQILTVSVAAQLGVLPLSLYYFHQFPGLFFLTNLVIIPFLGIILSVGIIIIALAMTSILPPFLTNIYNTIIKMLNQFIDWIGQHESFLFDDISFSIMAVVLLYLIIICVFNWVGNRKYFNFVSILVAIFLFQSNSIVQKGIHHRDQIIVFNKTKQSLIGVQKKNKLDIYTSNIENYQAIYEHKAYLIRTHTTLNSINPLQNAYQLKNQELLIMDETAIIPSLNMSSPIIILSSSTSINLERLIRAKKPSLIIADASNFKSLIPLWEKTCKTYNIKFHYTVRDGAFLRQL